ncbi:MAG: CopG family transcriptional regulator [Acidimicrobiales bacterium]
MARTQTIVQLTDDLIAALDSEAARRGVSRSAIIREAVASHVADRRDEIVTRAIVDGYRRIPPGQPDEWGDLERLSDQAAIETLQRLEAEERTAGFEPW